MVLESIISTYRNHAQIYTCACGFSAWVYRCLFAETIDPFNAHMQTLARCSFCSHHLDNEGLVKKTISELKIFHPDLRRFLVVIASGWKQLFLDTFKISAFKMSHNISPAETKKNLIKKVAILSNLTKR